MLGMVNQAVEDMALSLGGEPLWRRIAEGAGLDPELGFGRMEQYPDELTMNLVASASRVLEISPERVLEEFGKHWILYTAENGYGHLLRGAGTDLPTFLGSLNLLHGKVETLMPSTRCPRFQTQTTGPHSLRLTYQSHRAGLAPLVAGLLVGLGERFGTPVRIHRNEATAGGQVFELEWGDST